MSAPDALPLSEALLRERAWIQALARHLVRDETAADDLAQETWRVALERPPEDRRSLRGWIARVMARLAGRGRRGDGRRRRREEVVARAEAVPSTAALVAEAELHRRLVDAVLALDEPYRSAVLARYVHGLTPRELAARGGDPVKTIASRLHRGLALLRARLDAAGHGDRRAWAVALALGGVDGPGADAGGPAAGGTAGGTGGATGGAATVAAAGGLGMATTSSKGAWVAAAALLALAVGVVLRVRGTAPGGDARDSSAPVDRPGEKTAPALAAASTPSSGDAGATPGDATPVRVRGRVVDREGRPVLGAVVTPVAADAFRFIAASDAAGGTAEGVSGQTGADGAFDIGVSDDAPMHLLLVSASGHAPFVEGPVRVGRAAEIVLPSGERWQGRVVDDAGAPVPNATVSALLAMPWFRLERSTVSDDRGAFAFDGMPGDTADRPGRFPPQAWVEVRASGAAPAVLRVLGGGTEPDRRALVLVVRRGASLSGRVVDAERGEPVAGAGVELRFASLGHGWMQGNVVAGVSVAHSPFEARPIASTSTGPDGAFVLEHVPALDGPRPPAVRASDDRRPYAGQLVVRAPGRATAVELVRQVEDGGRDVREVRLWRGVAVSGRIVRADRTSAPRVQGRITVGPPVGAVVGFTTDPDGRFVATDVPVPSAAVEGTLAVFGPSGEQRWPVALRPGAPIDAGEFALPALTLPPGVEAIAVRVVRDEPTPIRGAWVQVVSPRGGSTSEVETDRDGRATVFAGEGLRATDGSVEVRCWAPGYARATLRIRRGDGVVGPPVDIALVEGLVISGRVVRDDGSPAARHVVRARRDGAGQASAAEDEPSTSTDGDGWFSLHDLEPGAFTLVAFAPQAGIGAATPQATKAAVAAGTRDVVLMMPAEVRGPLARVTVAVLDDATGEAIPMASVTMRPVGASGVAGAPRPTIFPLPGVVTGGSPTDPHLAPDVPVGAWSVRAWADGYATSTVERLEVPADGAHVVVRLRRGAARPVRATGLARDESPRQLRLVPVEADREVSAVLDDEGRGELRGLEAGTYRPTLGRLDPFERGKRGTTRVFVAADPVLRVEDGADPIDLTLVAGGVLSVDVEDPRLPGIGGLRDPAAVARSAATTLTLHDARGRLIARRRDVLRGRQGGFDMVAVLPGRYHLRLDVTGEAPIDLDVDVAAGDHVLHTIPAAR